MLIARFIPLDRYNKGDFSFSHTYDETGELEFHTYNVTVAEKAPVAEDYVETIGTPPPGPTMAVETMRLTLEDLEAQQIELNESPLTSSEKDAVAQAIKDYEDAIANYEERLNDDAIPIQSVLVVDENSAPVALQVYAQRDGDGWKIIDMTDPKKPREYSVDGSLEEGWQKFVDDTLLPSGQIAAIDPDTGEVWNGHSDGGSTWQQFSENASFASVGLFVLGGLAYLSTPLTGPAGPTVGSGLWIAASGVGALGAIANIYDRSSHGQFSWGSQETFFDAVDIVGALAVGAGPAYNAISNSTKVTRVGNVVKVVNYADNGLTVVSTVVINVNYWQQIEDIQNRTDLTEEEKKAETARIMAEAAAVNAMVIGGGAAARRARQTGMALPPGRVDSFDLAKIYTGPELQRLVERYGLDAVRVAHSPNPRTGEFPTQQQALNKLRALEAFDNGRSPRLRTDLGTHASAVDRRPDGSYVFNKKNGFSGGHNADEFHRALQDPRGAGEPGSIVSTTDIVDNNGVKIGEEIVYQVPALTSSGEVQLNSDGSVVYAAKEYKKSVYDPQVISDAEMVQRLEAAGVEVYNNNIESLIESGKSSKNISYVDSDGVPYVVYLKVRPDGTPYVDNVHIGLPGEG